MACESNEAMSLLSLCTLNAVTVSQIEVPLTGDPKHRHKSDATFKALTHGGGPPERSKEMVGHIPLSRISRKPSKN